MAGEPSDIRPQDRARSLTERAKSALAAGEALSALKIYDEALRIDPDFVPALHGRCFAFQAMGRSADVIEACDRALVRTPDMAFLHYGRGVGLRLLGRVAEAESAFRRAVTLNPADAGSHVALGLVLEAQGHLAAARSAYESAIGQDPNDADGLNNLGNLLNRMGERKAAIDCLQRAIAHRPAFVEAINNLGTVQTAEGDLPGALASYRRALALRPDFTPALVNLGAGLSEAGDPRGAMAAYDKALAASPENSVARWNRALTRLLLEDLTGGWSDYASRWGTKDFEARRRSHPQPLWDGGRLAGRGLLLWSEQGIGDEIMFLGLLPELIATGVKVALECDARLIPLIRRAMPDVELIARTDIPDPRTKSPEYSTQAPTGDLLRWLRPRRELIRRLGGYLSADVKLTAELRRRYRGADGERLLGLAWHSTNPSVGHRRSIPSTSLAPFLNLPGWRSIDLQYGDRRADRAELAEAAGCELFHDHAIDAMRDVDGWAAQIAAMDVVVTIDNSVVHLAAALGKPVLLLLPKVPDWRWFAAGDTSVWYSGVRLLRQVRTGDWDEPLQRGLSLLADWPR
jgi:tetratricopeptide (TPR) repeat protein